MNIAKHAVFSMGWVAASFVGVLLLEELRKIGTTWTNDAGFLRTLVLFACGVLFAVLPLVFAVTAWFGQPRELYKKVMG